MANSEKNFSELVHLVSLYTEGELGFDDGQRLEELLYDPDIRQLYFEVMDVNLGLEYLGDSFEILNQDVRNNLDPSILKALADYEKIAPTLPPQCYDFRIEDPILPPKPKVHINKTKVAIFSMVSLAAIFMVTFLVSFGVFQNTTKVASVSDSFNAKWGEGSRYLESGDRLISGEAKYVIQEGLVELQFDNGANVVIEAPTEFQILADDRIGIRYGKLYSKVPREAIGFSVYTPNAKIVDMGTEFGVRTDMWGDTYLQVIKGRTALIAGNNSDKASIDVLKGDAKKISAGTNEVVDVEYDKKLFVRTFDSREKFIWKGRAFIDLADIVGSGSGLGNGKRNIGIDPTSGKVTYLKFSDRNSTNEFRLVSNSSLIDGVFVPNGGSEQVISSYGHIFEECPASSGIFYSDIINSPEPVELGKTLPYDKLTLNSDSVILMHANLGITFDLDAIRALMPDTKIVRFTGNCGLAGSPPRLLNADFWVLVDGELKFQKSQLKQNNVYTDIEIDISDENRFLTLVVTDGGDQKDRRYGDKELSPIDMDWGVFNHPVLVLE